MKMTLEPSWREILKEEFDKKYFDDLTKFVEAEFDSSVCYPLIKDVFKAFELCPFEKVKVVIIGQDPYIKKGQAHGLCFSVKHGTTFPPSLKNVYKELSEDIGIEIPISGDLSHWASQGVLLLNATLTVREGDSNSHEGKGWGLFTDAVIKRLNEEKSNVVYLLWGAFAQKKAKEVNRENNKVLHTVHPSPLSAYRGFFGCKHFSKTNQYLVEVGVNPINWQSEL